MDDSDNLKGNYAMQAYAEQMKSLSLNINPAILEQAERIIKLQSGFKLPESTLASIRTIQKLASGAKVFQSALADSALNKSLKYYSNLGSSVSSTISSSYLDSLQNTLKNYSSSFKIPESFANLHSQLQQFSDTTNVRLSGSLNSIAAVRAIAHGHVEAIRNLDSFEALENLKDSPFSADYEGGSYDQCANSEVSLEDLDNSVVSIDELKELDTEILLELEGVADFESLPTRTQKKIGELWHLFWLNLIVTILVQAVLLVGSELVADFSGAETCQEVKERVKQAQSKFDSSLLAAYRVTTASNLHLRTEGHTKSDIMALLTRGTVVKVLDSSKKAWLLVEVEVDGEVLQGWVFRRYTTYFK